MRVVIRALAGVLLIFAVGCADPPAAPTTADALGSRGATERAAGFNPADAGSTPAESANHPTLTLTVTPDGDRDRVRASIGGITGVSFYPGPGEKMPPNPLNGHGGQSITVRCDRTVSWSSGRPRVRAIPVAKRRNGDGVEIRVWVEHRGRKITHAGNAWAADGGSEYRVCAP